MKKLILFSILIFLFTPQLVFGQPRPSQEDCMQMDYQYDLNYCYFPDGSKCLLSEFNSGVCGNKFKKDYCISRGEYIYEPEVQKCCSGLKPYLREDSLWGEPPACQPYYYSFKDKIFSFILSFIKPINGFYALIILAVIFLIYWTIKRRLKSRM
ncbi:MAG: hypothetical protein ABIG60_05260 [Patescibacteria group bacterium]